ncbi:hypothetical protein [Paraglaciecola sp.]|uniref:hypothetical protein n=1 Tax=Paraglaciecola sp. TaxID=1920173 RepID=UPI003264ECD8
MQALLRKIHLYLTLFNSPSNASKSEVNDEYKPPNGIPKRFFLWLLLCTGVYCNHFFLSRVLVLFTLYFKQINAAELNCLLGWGVYIFYTQKAEEKSFGFNLKLGEIKRISQGKHGVQKIVLEITDSNNETYRVIVKDYQEWESQLKK